MNQSSLAPTERARKNVEVNATPLAQGCSALQMAFIGCSPDATQADIRRTWNTWQSMIDRCMIPGHVRANRYGDRGIAVCHRWFSFANFVADMGMRPDGKTLDRIDGNGPYTRDNCRWSTPKEQARNTSRTVMVGDMTQREAAIVAGVHESTIARRIGRGMTPQEAIYGNR